MYSDSPFFINLVIPFLSRNLRQKLIFAFLLFWYYILACPTSFHTPISCTYFCYGPQEPQSQSIWQTHLHFQGYVTNYYFFHIFQIKLFFCLLIYLCLPGFFIFSYVECEVIMFILSLFSFFLFQNKVWHKSLTQIWHIIFHTYICFFKFPGICNTFHFLPIFSPPSRQPMPQKLPKYVI